MIRFPSHDVGRLNEHHMIELQALGEGRRNQDRLEGLGDIYRNSGEVGTGVEDLRILADQVVIQLFPLQ
jgi:hypothetical protein